ncbi:MAG: MFS transporter [Clostridiales bacterium]|nr:MFS transporter [Clostridiales bacterium]
MFKKIKETFRKDSSWKMFLLSILVTGIGYGLYKGLLDNYLSEAVQLGEFDRGIAEFFREIPGLLLIFILMALSMYSAERIYKIGAVIMLCGMVMVSAVPANKVLVILAMSVYSLGEHIQLGMKSTLSLEYSVTGQGGKALGYQNSTSNIGTLFGYAVIIGVFALIGRETEKPFRPFFMAASVLIGAGMLITFRIRGNSATDKNNRRFYFRKKFTKYYMLEVFYGARKQVFFTFGPYALIRVYGATPEVISLLFAVSAICCYFLSPVVGSIIDRIGYKKVMVADTLILVIVCFFYGFAKDIFPMGVAMVVCCVNYVLDSIISLASMASNVYVQDISDSPEETRATISTGISVNHLITVFIALFGGWVWQALGIETLFILSAILGLCNSAYAATIRTGGKCRTAADK